MIKQTLNICLTGAIVLTMSFHICHADTTGSAERDYTVLPENGVIIAAFFPGNSTFSHSRIKNSVSRKKNKTKKIQKRFRINFNKFIEKEKNLIESFEKIEKNNRLFLYWQLGAAISGEEQQVKHKHYSSFLIQHLALTLNIPEKTIEKTRTLHETYPVIAFIPRTFSWEHIDLLLDISDDSVRHFYRTHTINNNVTPDELRVLIHSRVHEAVENED